MPRRSGCGEGWVGFQSAPGREAGRCAGNASSLACHVWFQSAPGREAGRCLVHQVHPVREYFVSIRARP